MSGTVISRKLRRLIVLSVPLLCLLFLFSNVFASTQTFSVSGTYGQSDARAMLDMVNEFRHSSDAWYWNSSNTGKVVCSNLQDLTYDYNLERIAMQRAIESSVRFAHERLSDDDGCSLVINGVRADGENLAYGSNTPEETLIQLEEAEFGYAGQGHRRAMLSSNFRAIGIGHVVVNGVHFWAQEFGRNVSSGNSYTAPNDSAFTQNVTLDTSSLELGAYLTPQSGSAGNNYSQYVGGTYDLPAVNAFLCNNVEYSLKILRWSNGNSYAIGFWQGVAVDGVTVTWSSDNTNVVRIVNNSRYSLVGIGDAVLTASVSYQGRSYQCTMNVNSKRIPISDSSIEVQVPSVTYNGSARTPAPVLTRDGVRLTSGDYEVTSYSANTNASQRASMVIEGRGNYTGSRTVYFTISPMDINDASVSAVISDQTYTGSALRPAPSVARGSTALTTSDYTVGTYSNNTNAREASASNPPSVTITGRGNYTGSRTITFTIDPMLLSNTSISASVPAQTYSGSALRPTPTVRRSSTSLVSGTDYVIGTYTNNTNAALSTAATHPSLSITGRGNYTGTISIPFTINPLSLNDSSINVSINDQIYSGSGLTPVPAVSRGSTVLRVGTDFTAGNYTNNINVRQSTAYSAPSVTITGTGNYTGSRTVKFSILPLDINDAGVTASAQDLIYTGSRLSPRLTVMRGGAFFTNYSITSTSEDMTNAGPVSVTIQGTGNFTGTMNIQFNIDPMPIDSASISATVASVTYNGSAQRPVPTVRRNGTGLVSGTDYTISTYTNNVNAASASAAVHPCVTITGRGNYTGSRTIAFTISPLSLSDSSITASIADQIYSGAALTPAPSVSRGSTALRSGTDYTIGTYSYNINARQSTASYSAPSVTISGTGNYTGSRTIKFSILPLDINEAGVTAEAEDLTYTGSRVSPRLTVMRGDSSFSSYSIASTSEDMTNAGPVSATIQGTGNFTGTIDVQFDILPRYISDARFASYIPAQSYCGTELTPDVDMYYVYGDPLVRNVDYTLAYENNIEAGNASVTINGIGNFTGSRSANFTITRELTDIRNCTVIIDPAEYVYEGEPVIPEILVKYGADILSEGVDYSVAISGNDATGTAYVTITGTGRFTGTTNASFTLVEPPAEELSDPTPTGTAPTSAPTEAPATEPTGTVPTGTGTTPPVTGTPSAAPSEATPAPSSESGVAGFVERLYTVALGRNSDPSGKQDWIDAITVRGNTGADAARGFLYSSEFLNKQVTNEDFVRVLYRTFFDREPDQAGFNAWVNALNGGASKQDVIEGFINSTEWANLCLRYGIAGGGTGVPNVEVEPSQGTVDFCTRLYTTCLGRAADSNGLMAWARQLANQRDTGTGAARGFFFSSEFTGQNVSNGEYVTRLYRTFMGREPDEAGYNAWVAQLDSGISREEVFEGFAQSPEFTRICASYGIIR